MWRQGYSEQVGKQAGRRCSLWGLAGLVALATVALLAAEAWADEGFDPPAWSQILKVSKRFKLVMGGAAVLDKETGLVWEQSTGDTDGDTDVDNDDKLTWQFARFHCADKIVGGRKGWRLPSVAELASLIDQSATLPPGHPFSNVREADYWSATTDAFDPTFAWVGDFSGVGGDGVSANGKVQPNFVWCVRGGMNADQY